MKQLALALGMLSASCGVGSQDETVTLYRNSPWSHSMRVHWATFDADDRDGYNLNNCLMAAAILNANMNAAAEAEGSKRDETVGFWCEPGSFDEEGEVPLHFSAQFPWT